MKYINTQLSVVIFSMFSSVFSLSQSPLSERPKIRLPRQLRTKYIKRVGEKVNLVIPFQVSNAHTFFCSVLVSCYFSVQSLGFAAVQIID